MFSGIVAEVGTVEGVDGGVVRVRAPLSLRRAKLGGSIAVNGVCLTAASIDGDVFSADVMPETFKRTGLGGLGAGAPVNLEPALGYGDEVGGHLVQGHIDGVGAVIGVETDDNARWVKVRVPLEVLEYCVLKGSIAIDGTSLTIASIEDDVVGVSLIPHTLESTIAGSYAPGTIVNLEADLLAKYVARYLADGRGTTMGPTGAVDAGGGHPQTEKH
ncbi:MAG TPA: riboflavin synthase [Candidatus Solibacter sp.]|jgi:riboflavin synthase|nr:riboflavin synthase [Candidatus Solibacter sp.]